MTGTIGSVASSREGGKGLLRHNGGGEFETADCPRAPAGLATAAELEGSCDGHRRGAVLGEGGGQLGTMEAL